MSNRISQMVAAWCGFGTMAVMFLGLWPAGFLPLPPPPSLSAAEIAEIYRSHTMGIRFGGMLTVGASGLFLMFSAQVSATLRRHVEAGVTPIWSTVQLAAGTATSFLFLIPGMFWTIAAFHPERSPEITQALSDVGFLFFLMPFFPAAIQDLAIGFAILGDRSKNPAFPRWVGWQSLWVFFLFLPAGLAGTFKRGPFAWNGLFVWWIPLAIFAAWCTILTIYLVKAINRETAARADSQRAAA
jgi:hypothetical protein